MSNQYFGKRLAKLRKSRSLTQSQLAELIGMSHSTVASWETGTRDPDTNMIVKLSELFKVSTDYLLGTQTNAHLSNHTRFKSDMVNPNEQQTVDLEIYDGINADGSPYINFDSQLQLFQFAWAFVDKRLLAGHEGFAFRVKDNSMSGDRIKKGDVVIAIKQDKVEPDDIAVVSVGNELATLKRIKQQNGLCMLMPSNPQIQPELVSCEQVHILGKIVEVKFQP